MLQSFRMGIDALGPENVRSALPVGLLDSVKEDPRALVDPAAAQVLTETLAGTGRENLSLPDSLLWVAVALSISASLLLRVK
ncbi:MAG: hypothetical protein OXK78_07970 [Caldilineaceae bacterium]|nr:hypothetical protein [Caldilineaceae bacterium]